MQLEDIHYFSVKKIQQPSVFALAKKVYEACENNTDNNAEMQRRLYLLSRSSDGEHARKSGDFMAELAAFNELLDQGLSPKWLPESTTPGVKTPDIEIIIGQTPIPVEVKHLNDPRDEHEATYAGQSIGGMVDFNYKRFLVKKVQDLACDAKEKFTQYHKDKNDGGSVSSRLYLFFTKSIEADLADIAHTALAQYGGEKPKDMQEHIKAMAQPILDGADIELIVRELSAEFTV